MTRTAEIVRMADYDPTPADKRWGEFTGTYGLTKIGNAPRQGLARLVFWKRGAAVYFFTTDAANPLTFTDAAGNQYRPADKMETDMASIPWACQWWLAKDDFLEAAFFHDCAWRQGGLWFKPSGTGAWVWRTFNKWEANSLLRIMARAEGIGGFSAGAVLFGVSIGAALSPTKGATCPAPCPYQ